MGKLSRTKGKVFERKVANLLRARLPAETIRRSQQGRGAEEPDVCGVPGVWVECQDALDPDPVEKLEQAERDAPT